MLEQILMQKLKLIPQVYSIANPGVECQPHSKDIVTSVYIVLVYQ